MPRSRDEHAGRDRAGEFYAALEGLLVTRQEAKVLALVCERKNNPEIAALLGCARSTVKAHLSKLFLKLGVRSRGELASRGQAEADAWQRRNSARAPTGRP